MTHGVAGCKRNVYAVRVTYVQCVQMYKYCLTTIQLCFWTCESPTI